MKKNIRREDWQKLQPTIHGWGVNDVNYKVTKSIRLPIMNITNKHYTTIWFCPYYESWRSMIKRCLCPKYKEKRATYKDCTIDYRWKYLSKFIEWVDAQPNRDWQNCEPDKDLLILGNKHYSPDTVVFINIELNLFMSDYTTKKSGLLVGASLKKGVKAKPYRSYCSNPFIGKAEHLGYFSTELEAHLTWKAKKHEHACKLANLQSDHRVAEALRERYTPDKDWTK